MLNKSFVDGDSSTTGFNRLNNEIELQLISLIDDKI